MRMLDLFSGLGGASAAMVDRGWDVITVDADPRFGCTHTADLLTWQYPGPMPVDLLWASPPCQEFSRWGMPWLRAKNPPAPSLELVRASLRIVREVNPRHWIIENVMGAISWLAPILGRPVIKVGPQVLWGQFPPFPMPSDRGKKKESYSSTQVAERSMVPYALSLVVAKSCELPSLF